MQRKFIAIIVSLTLVLSMITTVVGAESLPQAAGAAHDSGSLIQNGSFEEGAGGWDDWGGTAVETTAVHDGSKAIKIGMTEGGMGQVTDGISAGKDYVISGWGKVSTTGETAILGIDCLNGSQRIQKFSINFKSVNYEKLAKRFTAPEGTTRIQVYIYKNEGSGYAYLDEICLKPAVNLIQNGTFDSGDPAAMVNWDNWDNTKVAAGKGFGGSNAVQMGTAEGGAGQIIDHIPANRTYTVSGLGKVDNAADTAILGVDCLQYNNTTKKYVKIKHFTVNFSGTGYENKSSTFTTPQGTEKLQVFIYNNGSTGYMYLDNLGLYPEDVNLVKNPDFELYDETSPLNVSGWDENLDDEGTAAPTKIVKDSGMENTNAIRIGDGEGGRGQIIRDIQPNTSYTLSGWGKVSEEGETGYLGVKCMDSTGKKLKAFGPAFTGTEYTYQSKTFTTPEGTAKVLVNVWKDPSAAGKSTYAYYDNISLCRNGTASQGTLITPVKPSSEVFYDDFTNGIDSAKWLIGKAQWGKDETGKEANGGVIPENVSVKNGIVEITGNGDQYTGPVKGINNDLSRRSDGKRTGGVITSKDFYASGRYEVRAKTLPKLGACSAFWTYMNDGAKNHEVDIEIPADKTINKVQTTTWVVDTENTTNVVDTPSVLGTKDGITDGNWHTYRFDWHTDTSNPRVEYYIDNKLVFTSKTRIPFAAGRFWCGVWFPNKWAGNPDFDTDKMQIDWVKITPFGEDGDQWLSNYDSTWADLTEYPPTGLPAVEPVNTHNIAYLLIDEMNTRRALTDDSVKDFVNQLKQNSIEYQFCDMGTMDASGKMPAAKSDLVNKWIKGSKATCPEQKVIATINGSLATIRTSETVRQTVADECKKLIADYGFDGIQVDIEPFRAEGNADLVDLLTKIRKAIGTNKHLSIATNCTQSCLPSGDITKIANVVDMINPMIYDACGPEEGSCKTADDYIKYCKEAVLYHSRAIASSSNKDCQLNPTMPIYEKTAYHTPAIENIPNEAKGITQAIREGAKVYGSGVFWWGNFISVPRDARDGQDYAKDRKWWLDDWVNLGSSSNQTITSFEALPSSVQVQSVANGAYPSLPKTLNAVVNGKAEAIGNITWTSSPEYNSAAAGTYTFTAVVPGGYKLNSGAALPQIIVTVASAHKNSDSDSHKNPTGTSGESAGVETSATGETVVTPTVGEVPVITGNKSDISVTVPGSAASAVLTATAEKPAKLKINVPTAAIVDQMKNSAVQTVGLTIMAPAAITNNTNPNASVAIRAEQAVLQAAKDAKKDITLAVANSETGKMAYSWTFKGADLAKSTAVKDIDLAISVCPTAEVSAVNKAVASSNKGLVLSFADNGVLPGNAIIKVNVADKNYKAGETVYFYYFNSKTQQLEAVGNTAYTVDQDGYVSVTISHCSDYVLLPKAANSLTLDTLGYTMAPHKSYEIGMKLSAAYDTTVKVYSSAGGVAKVTKLKTGNYQVTGLKAGLTYIMFDVYGKNGRLLTHASVKVTVQNGAKSDGISQKQVGLF